MKRVIFSNGGECLVDDEDYDFINQWKWIKSALGYGHRGTTAKDENGVSRGISVLMHRAIMQAPKGTVIDHIDGDRLNNRRSNLRFCTQRQNLRNRKLSKCSVTGYTGVTKYGSKFRAMIMINNKNKHLGLFKTAREAAEAYNAVAFSADPVHWKLNLFNN